jgi:uncharacterized protein YukE
MEQTNTQIINELLQEFKVHRASIMSMINDLEELKANVDRLFPQKLDARYMRFFEEKIKSATELFKTLLEMRKEIQKSLKEEIDLRRKVDLEGDEIDVEKSIDIRGLAEKVQSFQDKRNEVRQRTIEKAQRETDKIASEIVTIQEAK